MDKRKGARRSLRRLVRFTGAQQDQSSDCLLVDFLVSSEMEKAYNDLLRAGIPFDISREVILRLGANVLVGKRQSLIPTVSPEEELQRQTKKAQELDRDIQKAMSSLEEMHRNNLCYQEDNAILDFYADILNLVVSRMKAMLQDVTPRRGADEGDNGNAA
jgi:hypothetical protein